jgi:hypothetical protein
VLSRILNGLPHMAHIIALEIGCGKTVPIIPAFEAGKAVRTGQWY